MNATRLTAVFSSDELGGSELFNLEFLRVARHRGVRIDALVPGEGTLLAALKGLADRIEVVPIPDELTSLSRFHGGLEIGRLPARTIALVKYQGRLRRALAALPGPTLALGLRAQLAVALAAPAGAREVWIVHEIVPEGPAATMWRLASRRADRILTYSRAAAGQAALARRHATVHGVRFNLGRYAAVASGNGARRLGLIGDLVELKNHMGAIEVLSRVRQTAPDATLLLVGRDKSRWVPRTAPYVRNVRRMVDATSGAMITESSPDDMPAMLSEIDVLLHLSTEPESFGRVIVEAMAAGRPVVAFDHGAVRELINPGVTGWLCATGDLQAVADAVVQMHSEPDLRRRIGQTARTRALARFAADPGARDTVGDALADFVLQGR